MSEQQAPNPGTENAQAETLETGSEEAALAAMLKDEQPEQTEDAAKPDDEPEADPDAEPDEGEPAEEEPGDELVEVEHEGKTYKVAPEVQKAMLRQADYSRNMNAVTAEKKVVAQQKETADRLIEGAQKYAEALAEVNTIDARIKQFESVNWQSLRAQNPGEYAAMAADLQTLRLNRDGAVQKAKGIDGDVAQAKGKLLETKREEMVAALQKDLKGWGEKLGTEITQYAVSVGYSMQDIAMVTDPQWVIAMNKAMRYDNLQKGKVDLKAKVKDVPPVLKRGTTQRADPSRDAMGKFRESRSEEDAVKALLSMR